ncbi:DUF4232 domain-containing protein [Streptomyces antimicrobicus]|uniref:DUF4232 domain-containing protein n=1 Tax=Streptomyces antimicrobicus TaxID=2883108 RepID=A0ABS8B2E7_9ACTN|nr:DUF4232 domain-containing protein [Streptomyces antimicrobicus]MCB5178789.1 DUF4232 domain-containing protein [Streptomyces antimicrobicus]
MRMRCAAAVAGILVAGLGMTACGSGDGTKASASTSASAPASPAGATSGAPASASATPGKAAGGDDGVMAACTTKNTTVRFAVSPHHSSPQQPAAAVLTVTNASSAPCTIVGPSTLTAKDDQGKAGPVMVDNAGSSTDAVDLKPGQSASAYVHYEDVNDEGSASGREVCAVQASSVQFALPKDVDRTVKVTKADGSPAVFNVCDPDDVELAAFVRPV